MLLQDATRVPSLLAPSKQWNPYTEITGTQQDYSLSIIKNIKLIIIFF